MLFSMGFMFFCTNDYKSADYAHRRFETLSFITFRKNSLFLFFFKKNLHISKKSSNFAAENTTHRRCLWV